MRNPLRSPIREEYEYDNKMYWFMTVSAFLLGVIVITSLILVIQQ